MKKIIISIFVIGWLLTSTLASVNAIFPETHYPFNYIYVDDDATSGGDGSYYHPFQKIQDGVDAANLGDVVFVFNGIYKEDVVIKTSIILLGESKDYTVIVGYRNAVQICADDVTFQNFKITRDPNSDCTHFTGITAGYYTNKQSYANIQNNIICDGEAEWFKGIKIHGDYSKIQDNVIMNGTGKWCTMIEIHLSTNTIIKNNMIINGEGQYVRGIEMWDYSYNNIIADNIIKNMNAKNDGYAKGIVVSWYSSNNCITDNTIEDTSGDASIGISIDCSYDNNISRNTLTNNKQTGISLSNLESPGCVNNYVSENVITGSRHGILLNTVEPISGNNMLYNNDISKNDIGIHLFYQVFDNTVLSNNIYDNNIGVYLEGVSYNTVSANTISNNNYGIKVTNLVPFGSIWSYSKFNTIKENDITNNNLYGVFVGRKVVSNDFYFNNFVNNGGALLGGNAKDKGSNHWNIWKMGNYWDDYLGWDSDGDGIGDVPYVILPLLAGNKDNYPLMESYGNTHSTPTNN